VARFLLVLALLIVLVLVARQAVRRLLATPLGRQLQALWRVLDAAPAGQRRSSASSRSDQPAPAGQELVRCPGCGVYVPRGSLRDNSGERRCPRCLDGGSS
jgi:hypothetical protein